METPPAPRVSPEYDVFISHASEDKEAFVRPLAEDLDRAGLRVWYDENELRVGDSLTRSIDKGLANARFGLVILSRLFFAKRWPEYELRGLTARELDGRRLILPIWHGVTRQDVLAYSPSLADTKALATSDQPLDVIVDQVLDVVRFGTHSSWLIGKLRAGMQNLGSTTFHGYGHDYWPHGGLRSLYDHLLTFASFSQLARVFGRPVFLSGPHRETELDLNNHHDFGHYNPEFIDWLGSNVRFFLRQSKLVAATTKQFDTYLAGLATLMYETYQVLAANPSIKKMLRDHYENAIKSGNARPQYYWSLSWATVDLRYPTDVRALMNVLAQRYDSNVVSTIIYFWLRREIDGTDKPYFRCWWMC
jgi:hypothetical protein